MIIDSFQRIQKKAVSHETAPLTDQQTK